MKFQRKTILSTIILVFCTVFYTTNINPESVAEKALQKRNEIIGYLRDLRPMVYNFPCDPFPECNAPPAEGQEQEEGTYVKLYQDIKRVYQEGLVYFFERNFVNAYVRFLDCQIRTEQLVEGLSQLYLDRTEEMLRDSIDKKYPNDPDDKTVIDISIEFGPNSKMRRDFGKKRNSPAEIRRYDPRDYHYLWFKYEIESNMERGYQYLNSAKESRTKAVKVAKELAPHEKVQPNHRKKRIENLRGAFQVRRKLTSALTGKRDHSQAMSMGAKRLFGDDEED